MEIYRQLRKSPESTSKLSRVDFAMHEGVGPGAPSSSTSLYGCSSISISPSSSHSFELASQAHGFPKCFWMPVAIGSSLASPVAIVTRMYFVFPAESVPHVHCESSIKSRDPAEDHWMFSMPLRHTHCRPVIAPTVVGKQLETHLLVQRSR